jgi:hypothetical protein
MEKILSLSSCSLKLNGLAEGDEFYIKAGLKGRTYHDEIVKSAGRNPGKEGSNHGKVEVHFTRIIQ